MYEKKAIRFVGVIDFYGALRGIYTADSASKGSYAELYKNSY